MEAKDTVMNYEEKKRHGGYDPVVQVYVTGVDIINIQQNLCDAQAEISFKAGIREVEKIVKDYFNMSWGEFSKAHPQVEKAPLSGGEMLQAIEMLLTGGKPN